MNDQTQEQQDEFTEEERGEILATMERVKQKREQARLAPLIAQYKAEIVQLGRSSQGRKNAFEAEQIRAKYRALGVDTDNVHFSV
jgi:hypothetical protein